MKVPDFALWEEFKKTIRPLAKRFFVPLSQVTEQNASFKKKKRPCFSHTVHPPVMLPYVLDLHGFCIQEAYTVFKSFVEHHFDRGSKHVRVITGHGLKTTGAIRREMDLWLDTPFFKQRIEKTSWTCSNGSVNILLKKNKKGK